MDNKEQPALLDILGDMVACRNRLEEMQLDSTAAMTLAAQAMFKQGAVGALDQALSQVGLMILLGEKVSNVVDAEIEEG